MLTRLFLGVVLLVSGAAFAQTSFPDHCDGGSPLPFSAIEVKHPIDSSCGIEGKPTSPANSHIQNKVKNNFCAIEAHHADLGGGESVNCNGGKEQDNDIHIALGSQADSQECESVSAEISPHYRPASWNEIGHFEIFNSTTKKYTPNPAMASRLQAHPYRITGQLFFDASHAPCPCSKACTPIRAAVWEIHPVYNIEVCKGTTCDENTDSDWLAFDVWWKSLVPIKKVKGPHTHTHAAN